MPNIKKRKLNSISHLFLVICYLLFIPLISSIALASPVLALNCPPGYHEDADQFGNVGCVADSSGGTGAIGKITNTNLPSIPAGGENTFVAGLVRNGLQLLLIVAFIIDLIWTILAGFQFIFAGGDPKNISTAWSRIYWGLIGMVIVLASFAIIRIVEIFFDIRLISGGLSLPRI